MELPRTVSGVVENLKSDESITQIWLIGSQANNSASPESDWDLLVFSTRESVLSFDPKPQVDVLWKGPSGRVLLLGMPESYSLLFSDFQWKLIGPGKAMYRGRRFVDIPNEVKDASEQPQVMLIQSAVCLWDRQGAYQAHHGEVI